MQLDDLNKAITAVAIRTLIVMHSTLLEMKRLPSLKIIRPAHV
jgi:hypothetical protein